MTVLHIGFFYQLQETPGPLSEEKKKMLFLTDMGYPVEEVSIAIERCGMCRFVYRTRK